MEDLSHNLEGYSDRTNDLQDNAGINRNEESQTVVSRCTDKEYNSLLDNCCRGLFVNNKQYTIKNEAIETTTKPSLGLATKNTKRVTKEFFSKIEMNRFEKSLKSAGSSFDISLSLQDLKINTSNTKNDSSIKVKDVVTKKVFFAIVQYTFVAVNSIQMFHQNLKLTLLALSEIRKIEEVISNMGEQNKSIRDLCCKFIDTFGSHVCNENIDIGGILKTSTLYESETQMTFENCQELAKRAHAGYIKYLTTADAEGKFDFKDETNKETRIKAEESKFVFSCSQLSYPSEDWNHTNWLKTLLKHPAYWCVIGRGFPTGIWNILLNHYNDLSDCYRIAAMIRNAWQTKWNQNPDEELDQIVQCAISSISDFIGRIRNLSLENITEVIVKLSCYAGLNQRFREYWSVSKFVSFFEIAVTKSNELPLKHKVCLKILLGLLCQSTLNEHEHVLKWFKSPLFRCTDNVFEAVIYFINNAIKPIYTDMFNENAEKHWRSQVKEQITTEIAIIIKHHGEHFNDKTQCIYIARCVAKLGFDFEKMQPYGDNPLEDFFLAFSQEKIKMSYSKDLPFEKLIESVFFRAMHISKSIYPRYTELQLNTIFVDDLCDLCKKTLKIALDQKDLGTVLKIASLGFDINLRKFGRNPFCPITETRFKINALVWNTENPHIYFEGLTCYQAISALNSVFIETVDTLTTEVPEFIEKAFSFFEGFRSNICKQLEDMQTEISKQRECVTLEIIFSRALRNMKKSKKNQFKSKDDIRVLIENMASSLNGTSKEVSLYSKEIPSDQGKFVTFLKTNCLSLWKNSRTQLSNRCQSDASHAITVLDDFFKSELEHLCRMSLNVCPESNQLDIRSFTVQNLCNQPIVTYKQADIFLKVHYSRIKKFLRRFFRIFILLYEKLDIAYISAGTAYMENKKLLKALKHESPV